MSRHLASTDALYIAAKAPRVGLAKTRLARHLGDHAALDLYRAFLRDLGARFATFPQHYGGTLGWYITPPEAWPELAPLVCSAAAVRRTRFLAQGEGDWTSRQHRLFSGARGRGETRTVLMASDSPHLTPATIASAFHALDTHDLVLGPVLDGGYYLIGMRGWHDVLRGVAMSTGTVTAEIAARAAAQGLSVGWLPPTFDIDELADLDRLRPLAMVRPDLAATRATLRALAAQTAAPFPNDWRVPPGTVADIP